MTMDSFRKRGIAHIKITALHPSSYSSDIQTTNNLTTSIDPEFINHLNRLASSEP